MPKEPSSGTWTKQLGAYLVTATNRGGGCGRLLLRTAARICWMRVALRLCHEHFSRESMRGSYRPVFGLQGGEVRDQEGVLLGACPAGLHQDPRWLPQTQGMGRRVAATDRQALRRKRQENADDSVRCCDRGRGASSPQLQREILGGHNR